MGLRKYKYYFRKPRSAIVIDIIRWLAGAGVVLVAASSPYFVLNLSRIYRRWRHYSPYRLSDAFYQLRKKGFIKADMNGQQVQISLTEKGRRAAGWMQIDSLKINRPRRWDGKWRLVMFDIAQLKRTYREAFRGKLKSLGFKQLQKSVWIYPFDCEAEIELLQDFFGLSQDELRLVVTESIGDDAELRLLFELS